ncbi:MAG: hypothetical protein Q7R40_18810 [Phaeospirillum sp.]|nr:hypothetical protein [Phaeospirillum sp.]
MANVRALPGVTPQSFINEDAIKMVERVLDRLRTGEVVGVAYVAVKPTGTSTSGWNCPSAMGNHLFAGIARIQHDMMSTSGEA